MIKTLKLTDFRNFKSKSLEFSDKITTIVGPNGIGKTNILEALFLLSIGKSFKARTESEMLRYGQSITSITGITGTTRLEAKITTGENGWPKKRLLINGIPKRSIDFAGNFKTVLFGPWDMDLVTESPSVRRKFLDTVLSQTDREYRRAILSYEKGLRQRNKLLWRIREEGASRSQLLFWNQLLIKNGNYITEKREEFISFVNKQSLAKSEFGKDSKDSKVNEVSKAVKYQLEYDRSVISEGRLEQYAREEVASATTLVGPHRDDFVFEIRNPKSEIRNLASFGSRGEQRMGVLWLKMAELDYIEQESLKADPETHATGSGQASSGRPTLLLDDIFSELDYNHRKIVMEIAKKQQTIITSADEHLLEEINKVSDKIIEL